MRPSKVKMILCNFQIRNKEAGKSLLGQDISWGRACDSWGTTEGCRIGRAWGRPRQLTVWKSGICTPAEWLVPLDSLFCTSAFAISNPNIVLTLNRWHWPPRMTGRPSHQTCSPRSWLLYTHTSSRSPTLPSAPLLEAVPGSPFPPVLSKLHVSLPISFPNWFQPY